MRLLKEEKRVIRRKNLVRGNGGESGDDEPVEKGSRSKIKERGTEIRRGGGGGVRNGLHAI